MRTPRTVRGLEEFSRVRLSRSFFMRDFLYSDISNLHGIPNLPADPDLAISAGRRLCEELLEPLQATFGRLAIRSAYRSAAVNAFGNAHHNNCASNEHNYGRHIWDRRDARGSMGAMACIVIPWFADRLLEGAPWQAMAWWIHDHLPYSQLQFFRSSALSISDGRRIQNARSTVHPPSRVSDPTGHAEPYWRSFRSISGFPRPITRTCQRRGRLAMYSSLCISINRETVRRNSKVPSPAV